MKIIGLCGTSGSGKGYVSRVFLKYGVPTIDTDQIYREITIKKGAPCLRELVTQFGEQILDKNGELDRKSLASIVFEGYGSKKRLEKLNVIAHKYIKSDTEAILEKYKKEGKRAAIIDAPVLFESGFDTMCDFTIAVTAPYELKLERIISRDGILKEKAEARLKNQLNDDELVRLTTYQIDNSNCELDLQIENILKKENII